MLEKWCGFRSHLHSSCRVHPLRSRRRPSSHPRCCYATAVDCRRHGQSVATSLASAGLALHHELITTTTTIGIKLTYRFHNENISTYWDSATYEPLDACRQSVCKTAHFSIFHWSSSVEFGITEYYDPGRLRHAGSQDTGLSCHVPISKFCSTMWSQSIKVTEKWTDERHARSITRHARQYVALKTMNSCSFSLRFQVKN